MRSNGASKASAVLVLLAIAGGAAFFALRPDVAPTSPPAPTDAAVAAEPTISFTAISPRVVSNATDYPVMLYGEGFDEGLSLRLTGEETRIVSTTFIDSKHLLAHVPEGLSVDPNEAEGTYQIALVREGTATRSGPSPEPVPTSETLRLRVINDAKFPVPYDMVVSDGFVFVAVPTTDELFVAPFAGGEPIRVPVGDGPRSLALYEAAPGERYVVVAHDNAPELVLVRTTDAAHEPRHLAAPSNAQDVAVRGGIAYVTSRLTDAVHLIDLSSGDEVDRIAVGVNPRPIVVDEHGLAFVGNHGSNDVSIVDLEGQREVRTQPARGIAILGGHTEPFRDYVMGGKIPRDLAYSERLGVLFVSGIGPNIGPNPERMEVSMNGGISVVRPAREESALAASFVRHVSMIRGIPEGIALDDARGLLYAADIATGRVVVFDARKLATSDATARTALLGALELPVAPGTTLLRPEGDYGTGQRSSVSLYTGPRVVRLAEDGTLYVLERFTGRVVALDTRRASSGQLTVLRTIDVVPRTTQPDRVSGEIIYFTDLGNTRMTCDGCHHEGHVEGVLFTKGEPMHIYRSPSLRFSSETAPYFTPSLLPSLERTAHDVLARNRFENLPPTEQEIQALTVYEETITAPPNPYLSESFPERIALPDGASGRPLAGMTLFEGRAACTTCHPAPHFTTDQAPRTRARLHHVGTPITIPLRVEMQDAARYRVPPPSLSGGWDMFPLLHSGAGGFDVDGDAVRATYPFALRRVLDLAVASQRTEPHGNVAPLSEEERNDLLAYLLTL